MAETGTRLSTRIEFDRDGKQCDHLRLPHSVHRSAYGWLPVPLACIKNGDGPTVLLTSGVHGDEYEGQVTLTRLISALDPADVTGRIIIFPMANYPAAKAGLRTSPIDELNLNRVFPGKHDGRPTEMLAHYIDTELTPRADYMLDLHSGGSSLMYLPSLVLRDSAMPADLQAKIIELGRVFGAPYGFLFPAIRGVGGTNMRAAIARGVVAFGTEMGGGGNGHTRMPAHLRGPASGGCSATSASGTVRSRITRSRRRSRVCSLPNRGTFSPMQARTACSSLSSSSAPRWKRASSQA